MALECVDHKSLNTVATYGEQNTFRIKNWYTLGETSSDIQHLLQRAWEDKAWIRCDCKTSAPPVMHIRRKRSGFYIVRMRNHGEHAANCPFSSRPFSGTPGKNISSGQRLPYLKELLLRLLHVGHMNHISYNAAGQPIPLKFQYEHLHDAAKTILLANGKSLHEVLVTHPNGLHRLRKSLEANKKHLDTTSQDDSGYLFLMADRLDKGAAYVQSKGRVHKINIFGQRHIEHIEHKGPWIGLIEINRVEQADREYHGLSAYFMPAVSKALLCPVTEEEQSTLKIIKSIQMLAKKNGAHIQCIKYLPDDDEYQQGLRFRLGRKQQQAEIGVVLNDTERDALPKGSLYHYQNADGSTHRTEAYFIKMLEQRFKS